MENPSPEQMYVETMTTGEELNGVWKISQIHPENWKSSKIQNQESYLWLAVVQREGENPRIARFSSAEDLEIGDEVIVIQHTFDKSFLVATRNEPASD